MLIFTYCLKVLFKLSTLQDPLWDTSIVKATVDIVQIIQECAVAADRGNAELKEQTGEDSVLVAAAEVMRATAPNWRLPEQNIVTPRSGLMPTWNPGDTSDISSMDFTDDFWLQGTFTF